MSEIRMVIFDLDGTINDSSPGISYCFRKTGEKFGVHDIPEEKLNYGLSGPFVENITYILDLKPEQVDEAIKTYVGFYTAEGQSMSCLFGGMKDALRYLKSKGYLLGVATMMVEEYAKSTLQRYGILDMFDTVNGASFVVPYTKKDLIDRCLTAMDVSPEEAVVIGDGTDDHRSANLCGTRFMGVTYGYEIDKEYCEEHGIEAIEFPGQIMDLF